MFEQKLEVPGKEPVDYVHAAVKTAIASIPKWWAASGAEILSLVLASPYEKRRDEFVEDLVWVVRETAARVDDLQPEKLGQNEVFVSAVANAVRIAMGTHQREKLDALRNAVLNVALNHGPDEDEQTMFLGFIEAFSTTHLALLASSATVGHIPTITRWR